MYITPLLSFANKKNRQGLLDSYFNLLKKIVNTFRQNIRQPKLPLYKKKEEYEKTKKIISSSIVYFLFVDKKCLNYEQIETL